MVDWWRCNRRFTNNLGQRRAIGAHDGQATCHRLERWKAKAFKQRGEEEAVGRGVGAGQFGEFDVPSTDNSSRTGRNLLIEVV